MPVAQLNLKKRTLLRVLQSFLLGTAICLASLSGSQAAEQGQSASAPERSLRLARESRAAGDFSSAVNLFRNALDIGGEKPDVELELAETLIDAGAYYDALQLYTKLTTENPAGLQALLGLTRVELALGQPDKAIAYADKAYAAAPADPGVLIVRGVTLDAQGRHGDAQVSYRAMLAVSPFDIAARNDLALSLALTGGFDEAIDIMTPIARSSNATPRSRQNLALIYGLKGDRGSATALSRIDLDAEATDANLKLLDMVRSAK